MTGSLAIAADLARVISLMRARPDAREEQRASFRLLVSSIGAGDLVAHVHPDGLSINETPIPTTVPEIGELEALLRAHGIGELRVPAGLMTSTLLSFVRTLAAEPGTYSSFDHLVARLDAVGAGSVQVFPPASSALADLVPTENHRPPQTRPSVPPAPTPPLPPDPRAAARSRADDGALNDLGPDALSESKVGMMHFATLEMKAMPKVEDIVTDLGTSKSDAATGDLLNTMVAAGEGSASRHEWTALLKAAIALIELEAKGGASAQSRAYGIALRRMLPRSALEPIAKLATSGPYKADAITVLRRMGADGTEILLSLLSQAPNVNDRRGYFNALTQMTEGTNLMVHMLGHDEWFVVRNIAELCGELRLEEAIPQLAKRVTHPDERVRRAVAGALGKIGGPGTVEALRTALKDQSPAVRLQAAMGVDGRKTRGLAMTLAVAAEEEHKADVQREMFLALGRIASPEALQALSKAAEPGGRFFKRKPSGVRLAAIEGLHLGGPSAANALKMLLEDEESEVREAAEKALATLWDG